MKPSTNSRVDLMSSERTWRSTTSLSAMVLSSESRDQTDYSSPGPPSVLVPPSGQPRPDSLFSTRTSFSAAETRLTVLLQVLLQGCRDQTCCSPPGPPLVLWPPSGLPRPDSLFSTTSAQSTFRLHSLMNRFDWLSARRWGTSVES